MGIKDLKLLIKKFTPECIIKKHYNEINNKTIAVDISIYLYKFMYGNNNLILNFLKQIEKLKQYNIKPIYVFDGKPPDEKQTIIDNRKEIKRKKYERKEDIEKKILEYDKIISESSNSEQVKIYEENKKILTIELNKLKLTIINIKDSDILSLKELFDYLGILYIQADTEAEIVCSQLCKQGIVYGCLSDDTDVLANGSFKFLTCYNFKNDFLIEYDYNLILEKLELTKEQFVDLCILCGCDYTCKINKVAYITAYKLIKEYKSIENIIENIKTNEKYNINEVFLKKFDYKKCRDIFLNSSYDLSQYNLDEKKYNKDELLKFVKKNKINYDINKLEINTAEVNTAEVNTAEVNTA